MGYTYYILTQGYKDNKWEDVNYYNAHGTYALFYESYWKSYTMS